MPGKIPIHTVQIQILVDNQAGDNLVAEHGFAAWIEASGLRILFDTGQGNALESNAQRLNRDLAMVDRVVLSHGHYDHTGGLPYLLDQNKSCILYAHHDCTRNRFSIHEGKAPKDVSMPASAQSALRELAEDRVHWVTEPMQIGPGIWATGPIPRKHPMEDTGGPFYLDRQGKRKDWILDDLALWLETDAGLVVITGCCHSGVINTLDYIRECTEGRRVHSIVGGLHLHSATEMRLKATAEAFRKWNIGQIVACHCTGIEPTRYLRSSLGESVIPGYAGFMVPSRSDPWRND